MLNQPRNPRSFGVNDKPRCLNCGGLTFLTRRAPAAEHALEYERQTFTCPGCERQFERICQREACAVSGVELADRLS